MYREVTMIEIREVLRLRGEGLPKKRHRRPARARSENGPALSERRRDGGRPRDGRRSATRRSGRSLLALHPVGRAAARRRLGAVWRAARGDRALARRRPAPDQDSQAAGPPGRRDRVSHAASVRGPRAAVWQDRDDDPGPRRRARAGAAGRHGLGRLAHAAGGRSGGFARGSLPRCARATASSIRPSRKRPRARSRRARPRGTSSAASSRSSSRITPRRSSSTRIR